ncbi:17319_t:CDS:2 [Dentiscutata erythropus]|uniref:Ribonuclease P protein subunit p20 n=1 Tax=Dentiscutata erythropus TaxID=1348616 RepID=A0A9N9GGU0_9GLOM|nr:17319_t:CDS:2 [Dentiscutata erythropus]
MGKRKKKHVPTSPQNTSQILKKRKPQRPATIPTDIYVSRSSNFKGQLQRAKKLLIKDGHPSITIHGLGAMIQKSINLVLALKDLTHNQIIYKATTGTVELIDDIIPEDDDKDLEVQTRNNSSIRIQIWLKESIEKLV